MKIGLIAMSGVRAHDEELMKVGLTLPGFVERSKVIASLPSLSLLTIAALTPADIDVEYREIKDFAQKDSLPTDYDLVAISSLSAQISDAYQVADFYRQKKIPVVMGGLHVSSLPQEAKEHCLAVVAGEGEILWPRVMQDFINGCLQEFYIQSPNESFDLADAPMPRFELLDISKYNRLTVQTSRGCPHRCDFCASSILLTTKYKVKPVAKVIAEIRRIKELWPHPFIEFADDNSFVLRAHYKELLRALIPEDIRWFTEADISIAEDAELLQLMKQSGCKQVLIGLESPTSAGLDHVEQRRNWKQGKHEYYEKAIEEIQAHGIAVNGCFILGLDGDDQSVFDRVYQFVEKTGLFEVQITVLTPFPGTPLYQRFKQQGRLIQERAWHTCTLFDINYFPKKMSVPQLRAGMIDLSRKLYDQEFIDQRRKKFFKNIRYRYSENN
ncbi:MAG: B12-binding domain-containing radical SAM protein [Candidatus Omnitrophica bacterium]|nr:B12-binding domain-containing radical SAM protein [Candidatus Omnitrophota bacterium]